MPNSPIRLPQSRASFLAATIAAALLAGCASVSVNQESLDAHQPPPAVPERIFIAEYDIADGALRADRDGEDLDQVRSKIRADFAARLGTRLTKFIAPAEILPADAKPPRGNYWLITGRFDRVNQGSRALRALIGLGAGGTKMETTTTVLDLRTAPPRPFLELKTTGGSNAGPGMIATLSIFTAVPTAVSQAVSTGITMDANRTARMITAALSEYLANRGATDPATALRPKRPGSVPGLY